MSQKVSDFLESGTALYQSCSQCMAQDMRPVDTLFQSTAFCRPSTTRRELFVRHRPPINGSVDPDIVRNAVRNAAKRCGLEQRIHGTHILRHTLAARLVQSGTRFKEIADLLRHRNLDTTTIYAKVDLPTLARVALPWPGREL